MANKWLQHLNNFRQANQHVDAKDMMREARKSYKGGGVSAYVQNNLASTASSLQGGRRRSRKRSSKSRRTRRR
jgi:hypothetical protein